MLSIMTRMPTTVTAEETICERLWPKGLVDGIHIIGEAGKHFAMGGAVEVAQGQAMDFFTDLAAHPIGNVNGNPGHNPSLEIAQDGREDVKYQRGHQDTANGGEIHAGAATADLPHQALKELGGGIAQNFRAKDLENRRSSGQEKHQQHQPAIGAKVGDELAHRPLEIARRFPFHHRHRPMPHRAAHTSRLQSRAHRSGAIAIAAV
jgi:hypothetical protein